jgi:hypothetical protein
LSDGKSIIYSVQQDSDILSLGGGDQAFADVYEQSGGVVAGIDRVSRRFGLMMMMKEDKLEKEVGDGGTGREEEWKRLVSWEHR